jgi:hypothetical protein
MSDDSSIRPLERLFLALSHGIYSDFGSLRSEYTIFIIAALEAKINKFRMKTSVSRLLPSLSKQ